MINPLDNCQTRNLSLYRKTKTRVLDLIFPEKCAGCYSPGQWLCSSCQQKILSQPPLIRQFENLTVYALANYRVKEVQRLINYLKYQGVTDIARVLAELLSIFFQQFIVQEVDLITAIPLHRKRFAERTFNQAELIAEQVSSLLEISTVDLLARTKYSSSQTALSDTDRQQNVKGIFSLEQAINSAYVGRTVLLIDDVVTSGATLESASQVLLDNGVYKVVGLTVASR